VASRILPLKIHNLDEEDKLTIENETGGVLRAIEFIYKEPGVNRPLKSTDAKIDNQNKTDYRNQVNKVANAIKELIQGLKKPSLVQASSASRPLFNTLDTKNSIAVLPFVNMSNDPEQEYFSDGITEEILNSLAKVKRLKVAGRTSSFQFKGKQNDLREVGRLLGVQNILEGSIRKQNGQVRVVIQLINAEDGFQLWSEKFDRKLDDIFVIQDEIADVTKRLEITLTEDELQGSPNPDLESYDHYLLGRYHLNQRTATGIIKAVKYFEKAIASDDKFALAYAGLADAYLLAAIGYAAIKDSFGLAKEMAEKAIQLNPSLSDPYVTLGYFHSNNWNWDAAQLNFDKAIEINPNNARAFQWLAQLHLYTREYPKAISISKKAREIDPLSVLIVTESAWPYSFQGRYTEAIAILNEALKLDNQFALAHYNIGDYSERSSEYEIALREFRLAVELSQRSPIMVAFYSACLIRVGQQNKGKELLEELLEVAKAGVSISLCIALVYEALGEKENTLRWLEKAIESKEPMVIAVNTFWMPFKGIRDDSRFHSLLNRLPPEISKIILNIN
jgi:adenylate cyclase